MSPRTADRITRCSLASAAAIAGGWIVIMAFGLASESWPALVHPGPGRLLADDRWSPTEGAYGLGPMILGTVFVTLGGVALAAPLALGTAVFCHAGRPGWVRSGVRLVHRIAAAVPSVVWGLFGLTTVVPWLARVQPPGVSALAGMVVLGCMLLPTLALLADASLAAVPESRTSSAAALGMDRWTIALVVTLPGARPGLLAAVVLAVARGLGETMAILMVSGNVVAVPSGLFDPIRTLTANIALEMAYATGTHRSVLFLSGLLVLAPIAALVTVRELRRGWRRE